MATPSRHSNTGDRCQCGAGPAHVAGQGLEAALCPHCDADRLTEACNDEDASPGASGPARAGLVVLGALLAFCLALGGCVRPRSPTVYRDTWQPATPLDVLPPLVRLALAVEPDDVALVQHAGGEFLGYHATRKAYALRAGSVGGTHFVAVAGTTTARTSCSSSLLGGVSIGVCSTATGYRPSKIAVFRVPAQRWGELPPHLVPPTSDVAPGARVFVTRDGCDVHGASLGVVRCGNDWKVRAWR